MTLIFLDIDGIILPFGAQSGPALAAGENPLVSGMNREHARRLAALPAEPIRATTWMHEAQPDTRPAAGPASLRGARARADINELNTWIHSPF